MTLFFAMVLDAIFGEPRWLWSRVPHPAVVFGRVIGWGTARLNHGDFRLAKGTAFIVILAVCAMALGWGLQSLGTLVTGIVAAILFAQKSLVDHVAAVARDLRYGLAAGRSSVAMIVGRDTRDMTGPDVARGAIESAAENFSDGVIAPIFWFAIAGLPGLFLYKMINTADSMIGYRTTEFERFGKAAARLDDMMNWVPARLTAALIALTHGCANQWAQISGDARQHRSPNAGWPEAAMARSIHTALSGPRSYDGERQDFAFVYPAGTKTPGAAQIEDAVRVLWRCWSVLLGLVFAGSALLWLLGA